MKETLLSPRLFSVLANSVVIPQHKTAEQMLWQNYQSLVSLEPFLPWKQTIRYIELSSGGIGEADETL